MSNNNGNTNDIDKTGDIISWVIIVILMLTIVLFPVGLIWLLYKLGVFKNRKPGANKEGSKLEEKAGNDNSNEVEEVLESDDISDEDQMCDYTATLAELREVISFVKDDVISKKALRIEELTEKIFKIAEENPQKQSQLRRFNNYYLPTTLKLLRSYATLEKQGVKGENIMSAKKNIGDILDTLVTGFEQQLDLLFKSDAIDIAADINVLENLMQQDGLKSDKSEFQVRSQH